jgi:hypothetical protein
LRLAILGSRGIPAQYGGFETFTEEVPMSLVTMGLEVTVVCQSEQKRDTYCSLAEGFGMPALEAMASGIPVCSSATRALSEICADATLPVHLGISIRSAMQSSN